MALLMSAVPALALGYLARAAASSAADAAALACAAQADVTRETDARGTVYGEAVAVDPAAGPAAALQAWGDNLAFLPLLRTQRFRATPDGAECVVQAEVRLASPTALFLGPTRRFVRVTSAARGFIPAS